jgi:hypothetical protein
LLQKEIPFLLEMPLRLYHLPGMHVGKFLGNVVQRYNLAVPGLRGAQWFRKSIETFAKRPFLPNFYVRLKF